MEITVFGSGSGGNCTLVRTGETALLIDAGFSASKIRTHLHSAGLAVADLSGILITHEHKDHAKGLRNLVKTCSVPVYCNRPTARKITECHLTGCPQENIHVFETGATFALADFSVRSFMVSHDADETVGFRIGHSEGILGVATDLGKVTRLVLDALRGVNALLLESNYDEDMLMASNRPWPLKQRIASLHGHLSNTDASEALEALLTDDLAHTWLYHISSECNTRDLALQTASKKNPHSSTRIRCTFQDTACEAVAL